MTQRPPLFPLMPALPLGALAATAAASIATWWRLRRLGAQLPPDADGRFLRWSGTGTDGTRLADGADSYVLHDGRIVAQTIHYRTESPQ